MFYYKKSFVLFSVLSKNSLEKIECPLIIKLNALFFGDFNSTRSSHWSWATRIEWSASSVAVCTTFGRAAARPPSRARLGPAETAPCPSSPRRVDSCFGGYCPHVDITSQNETHRTNARTFRQSLDTKSCAWDRSGAGWPCRADQTTRLCPLPLRRHLHGLNINNTLEHRCLLWAPGSINLILIRGIQYCEKVMERMRFSKPSD